MAVLHFHQIYSEDQIKQKTTENRAAFLTDYWRICQLHHPLGL